MLVLALVVQLQHVVLYHLPDAHSVGLVLHKEVDHFDESFPPQISSSILCGCAAFLGGWNPFRDGTERLVAQERSEARPRRRARCGARGAESKTQGPRRCPFWRQEMLGGRSRVM